MAPPAPGAAFPDVDLHGATPGESVKLLQALGAGPSIVVSVPGAFTPTCNKDHLPGYVDKADELRAAGAKEIIFVCPNDAFVTAAWGESLGAGKAGIVMLADPHLKLASALDQVTDGTVDALGGPRAKRFSCVVRDGKLAAGNWEPEGGTGLSCSRAGPDLIAQVKEAAGAA